MLKKGKSAIQIPQNLIAEYQYPKTVSIYDASCKVIFAPSPEHTKEFVVIVIATGILSPMNYPLETWKILNNMLNMFNINHSDVDFYLDYEDKYPGKNHFMCWNFVVTDKGDFISDSFDSDLLPSEIPTPVKKIRDQYYK